MFVPYIDPRVPFMPSTYITLNPGLAGFNMCLCIQVEYCNFYIFSFESWINQLKLHWFMWNILERSVLQYVEWLWRVHHKYTLLGLFRIIQPWAIGRMKTSNEAVVPSQKQRWLLLSLPQCGTQDHASSLLASARITGREWRITDKTA